MTTKTIETKNGTLIYDIVKEGRKYRGRVRHHLHKHPKFNDKVLTMYSDKAYRTERGAANWMGREFNTQKG